uniref:MADS-box transcription factor 23-like n=1 Tax=Rhizophora mucronata TaxID=61149 RepID=A0A2P2MUH4_RHIMU
MQILMIWYKDGIAVPIWLSYPFCLDTFQTLHQLAFQILQIFDAQTRKFFSHQLPAGITVEFRCASIIFVSVMLNI